MRNKFLLAGGLLAAAAVVVMNLRGASPNGSLHRKARELPEPVPSSKRASSGTSAELERLRAELRQKDQLLRKFAAASAVAAERVPNAAASPSVPDLDPAAKTQDLLDERLLLVSKDPAKAAEMERALRSAVDVSLPGEATLSSLYCGSALCRVIIKAGTESVVNQSLAAMSAHLPKLFGASLAFRLGAGERALYVAPSHQDLAVNLGE
jgi:hypothetical protein